MLLNGSGFTFLSLCFPFLPLYQHVVFPAPSSSVWLEEAEPLVLALPGRAGWLLFLWDECEDTGGSQRLVEGHEEKICLAQDIKWTRLWLLTFALLTFPLPVGRSGPFQESQPFVPSHPPPPHFPPDLLLRT